MFVFTHNINNYITNGLSSQHIYKIGEIRGSSSIDVYNKHINKLKAELPFVYLTGIRAFHSKDYELDYNGNLHVDLDFKNDFTLLISPSGKGLKLVISTLDYNPENYYPNLYRFGKYLSGKYVIDPITYKHVSFISYDKNCFYNSTKQREISLSEEEKVKIVKLIYKEII